MRTALVHDWLNGMRGGEKVLEAFAEMFPDAPIHTLLHVPGSTSPTIERHEIRTSALQRMPGAATRYRHYLPFFPRFVEGMRIAPTDLVLSDSSCVAKSVRPPAGAKHACYILSPMRYVYDRYDDYFAKGRASLATRAAMRLVRARLRRWDLRTADRVDDFAAISTFVQERVRNLYGREARVIAPPVDTERFANTAGRPGDYYLMVTALVPYKNADVAVEAFRTMPRRRLVIAGSGPWLQKLRAAAPQNVELLGWVEDPRVDELLAGCRAFLMPNVEDFGIAPVEAMAAGRPVVALGEGGILDTVRDLDRWSANQLPGKLGPTGMFYRDAGPAGLAAAIERFERVAAAFHPDDCQAQARKFSKARFAANIAGWLAEVLAQPGHAEVRRAA